MNLFLKRKLHMYGNPQPPFKPAYRFNDQVLARFDQCRKVAYLQYC